jgi:hypothetical protein
MCSASNPEPLAPLPAPQRLLVRADAAFRASCLGARRSMTTAAKWSSAEEGVMLIELLIAMLLMAIGIAALVAGFSSGILAVNRASLTSTAGSLADQQMELYRQAPFTSLPVTLQAATTPSGPNGHTYWMQVGGAWRAWSAAIPRGRRPAAPAHRRAVR